MKLSVIRSFVGMTSLATAFFATTTFAADPAVTGKPVAPAGGGAPVSDTTAAAPAEDDGKLQPGVIASFGNFPKRTAVNTSGNTTPGEKVSPVLARVVRKGAEQCEVVLTNSSKTDSYSVSFEVVGKGPKGDVAMRKSFSASIGPAGSTSRSVGCRKDLNMEVILKSGGRR